MNRLKVLVDLQALSIPAAMRRGAGVASVALTNALLRFAPDYEIYLLRANDGRKWQVGVVPAGVHDVDTVWNNPGLWFASDPARFMKNAGIDILYVTCPLIFGFHAPPTPPGVRVASQVHDLVPVVMAGQYLHAWPADLQVDYTRQLQFLREADLLLGSSRSTANDLVSHLKPRGRVRVAHLCTIREFKQMDQAEARRQVWQDLGLSRRYVLSVTEADPRKNTPGLMAGFAAAGLSMHQLVVAGMFVGSSREMVMQQARAQGVAGQVTTLDFVPHGLMNALYCGADLLVFPSLYEGFGLPSLEAMQCGLPIVAGDNSCFPEVVGDGGLLVDTSSPQALGAAMRRLAVDLTLRKALIGRGLRQAASFSYERTAGDITSAFAELVR
ncbi:MAG TPA: glycosyltransferase family 1 protein [Symbiobacteriaceae bacterium]